ncbi:hypothetical protein CSW58_03635 [Caulobacter sp. B11]|uniref:hypothetical protein n=1 Tax=Caulobacter sp. B11 TaxID=2048899 RepID=UPI000C12B864|nr:hypothetical protein [Caulobacter sp. B11]PHY13763.1 hypothetical protein CSW58_03635 [Caulobacter sp. B11]
MTEVHYGVVRVGEVWSIIGDHLRVGRYPTRDLAQAAAVRLAQQASGVGLPVHMHFQDDSGELLKPTFLG